MVLITYSRALINYGLEFLHEREYTPLQTPQLMLREQMAKTAQLSQYVGFPMFLVNLLNSNPGLMRNFTRSLATRRTSTSLL